MRTVREDLIADAASAPDGPTVAIVDDLGCRIWAKFDQLRRDGKLKVWGFIDASRVVAQALTAIIGSRSPGCH